MQVSTALCGSSLLEYRNEPSACNPIPYTLRPGGGQLLGTHPAFTYPWVMPETIHMRTFMVDFPYDPNLAHQGQGGRMGSNPLNGSHSTYHRSTEAVMPLNIPHELVGIGGRASKNLQEELVNVASSSKTSRSQHTLDQGRQTLNISSAVLDLVLNGSIEVLAHHRSAGSVGTWSPSLDEQWPIAVRPLKTQGGTIRGASAALAIPHGTELGPLPPLRALLATDAEFSICNQFLWEVYDVEGGLSHYVQPAGWMAHVGVAPTDSIQNLKVVQRGTDIYYQALRNIAEGETLLVWYSPNQPSFFGITLPSERSAILSSNATRLGHKDENKPQQTTSGVPADVTWFHLRCTVCKRGFNSRSNLRSHMRTHTLHRPFKCSFCDRGFSQSSTLRNHIRLHTGEKPYKCLVCRSSYSQLAGLRAHQKSARHRPKQPTISATPPTVDKTLPPLPVLIP